MRPHVELEPFEVMKLPQSRERKDSPSPFRNTGPTELISRFEM